MTDIQTTPSGLVVVGSSGKVGSGLRALGAWPDALWLSRVPTPGCLTVTDYHPEYLLPHLTACHTLVILAALTRHRHPEPLHQANVELPLRLARALMKRAPQARLIFLSSDLAAEPSSPYGRSKLEAEEALLHLHPDAVALRASLIATPPGAGIPAGVAAMARMVQSPWVPIIGTGGFPVRPLWVGDLAQAVELLAQRRGQEADRGVWSLFGTPLPYKSLLELLAQSQGAHPHYLPVPRPLLLLAGELLARLNPQTGFPLDFLKTLRHPTPLPQPPDLFAHLGLAPTPVENMVAGVLS